MTPLNQYAIAIAAFHSGLAAMAVYFSVVVFMGGSPITPEIYGGAVYGTPAVVWCAVQFSVASMAAVGAWFKWPVIAAVGAAGSALVYCAFGVLAMGAAQGTILQAAALCVGAPLSVLSALIAIRG